MNELWAQLMTSISQFWVSHSTAIIAGGAAFVPTMIAIVKTQAVNMFKRKTAEQSTVIDNKDEVIAMMSKKMDDMEAARSADMKVLGEAINTAFTNSNLAPEHKATITSQLNGLSGVSDTLANTLQQKTASIIESTKSQVSLDKVSEEIKAQGTSILSKFLNNTEES